MSSILTRFHKSFVKMRIYDILLFSALGVVWSAISFREVAHALGFTRSIYLEGKIFNFFSLLLLGLALRQAFRVCVSLYRQHAAFVAMERRFSEDVWHAENWPHLTGGSAPGSTISFPLDSKRAGFLDAVAMIMAREMIESKIPKERCLWTRLHQIVYILRITGDYTYVTGEVEKLMRRLNEEAENLMVWPRTIFWTIPSIGFLGTVSGISTSIASFTQRTGLSSLSPATAQLGIAFDATFIALLATVLVTICNGLSEHLAGRLHGRVQNWLIDSVVACTIIGHGTRGETPSQATPAPLPVVPEGAADIGHED